MAVKSPIRKIGGVALFLKVLELAQHDGVAEVQVGRRGIDAEFYAQRLARCARFSSLARSSSSRMISAAPLRSAAICSSAGRKMSFARWSFAFAVRGGSGLAAARGGPRCGNLPDSIRRTASV